MSPDAKAAREPDGSVLALLGDASVNVRANAAFALGMRRDAQALGPLSDALKKESSEVAKVAYHFALAMIRAAEATKDA